MLDMGLSPKFAERGSSALLYFKDTARVEDFLTLLGASRAIVTDRARSKAPKISEKR